MAGNLDLDDRLVQQVKKGDYEALMGYTGPLTKAERAFGSDDDNENSSSQPRIRKIKKKAKKTDTRALALLAFGN